MRLAPTLLFMSETRGLAKMRGGYRGVGSSEGAYIQTNVCATRGWQGRFYPFNVYSEKNRRKKLDYTHNNPDKRPLVSSPDQCPWSSYIFYYFNDASVLSMDRLG